MSNDQELYQTNTHVFIFKLKVWLEEKVEGNRKEKWRGYITHVPGGATQYFEDLDLDEIIQFILCYLKNTNVRIDWFWQLLGLLTQIRKRRKICHSINQDEAEDPKADL
jgi:hypothetical protein